MSGFASLYPTYLLRHDNALYQATVKSCTSKLNPRHQSNDAFWNNCDQRRDGKKDDKKIPGEEDLTKRRIESYQTSLKSERRDAFQTLTKSSIVIIIDMVFFFVHWRIARRARENAFK